MTLSVSEEPKIPKRRGPKPGSPRVGGKPKGYKFPETLKKEEGKELLRKMVFESLTPIVRGLIGKATGINHMMLRDETNGQWIRLTEQEQIEKALNAPGAEEGKTFWIHTKDPDVQAAADLLNRSIGRPTEEVTMDLNVHEPLAARILKARNRIANKN